MEKVMVAGNTACPDSPQVTLGSWGTRRRAAWGSSWAPWGMQGRREIMVIAGGFYCGGQLTLWQAQLTDCISWSHRNSQWEPLKNLNSDYILYYLGI